MHQPISGYRPFLLALFSVAAALAISCSPASESDCTSDADCNSGERCVRGGGVFVRGGVCVTRGTSPSDAADAPVDTSGGLDTSTDVATRDADARIEDTRKADTTAQDTDPPIDGVADTEPSRDGTDGGDTRDGGDTGETRDAGDTTDGGCEPIGGQACPCDYQGKTAGVCSSGRVGENGECTEPTDYEATESSCDGLDNDCDGATDEWCEAKLLGGQYEDRGTGVATDSNGNVYVVGFAQGKIAGKTTSSQSQAAVVIKYDRHARRQWLELIDTSADDRALDLAVGPNGNVFVTGATRGGLRGANSGRDDAFLVKMSPAGKVQWRVQNGDSETDRGNAVTVDEKGNVYSAGFSTDVLGSRTIVLRKYDANGTEQWSVTENSGEADVANDLDVRSGQGGGQGTLLLVGNTRGALNGQSNPSSSRNASGLVVTYDLKGNSRWTDIVGTSDWDVGFAGAITPRGTNYIAGKTDGNLGGSSRGGPDVFARRYTASGSSKWTRQFGSQQKDAARGGALVVEGGKARWHLTGYASGTVTTSGAYHVGGRDALITTYSSSGIRSGTDLLGTPQWEGADEVAVDDNGALYVVGSSEGDFAGQTNSGGRDLFVTRVR
jgi:hypothetical protein